MPTTAATLRNRSYDSIADVVGNTALIRLQRLAPEGVEVYLKMECDNPLASVKDRIGLSMIEAAEASGAISGVVRKQPCVFAAHTIHDPRRSSLAQVAAAWGDQSSLPTASTFGFAQRQCPWLRCQRSGHLPG